MDHELPPTEKLNDLLRFFAFETDRLFDEAERANEDGGLEGAVHGQRREQHSQLVPLLITLLEIRLPTIDDSEMLDEVHSTLEKAKEVRRRYVEYRLRQWMDVLYRYLETAKEAEAERDFERAKEYTELVEEMMEDLRQMIEEHGAGDLIADLFEERDPWQDDPEGWKRS